LSSSTKPSMKPFVLLTAMLAPGVAIAQSPIPEAPQRLPAFDLQILDLRAPRVDLPCLVTPVQPQLGWDLMFHTGYQLGIPFRYLAGPGDWLSIVFRVRAAGKQQPPVYFSQRIRIPPIPEGQTGKAVMNGAFLVSEGQYSVDWLVHNVEGQVCASFWTLEATTDRKGPALKPTTGELIQPVQASPFAEGSLQERARTGNISVKIIVNFAPDSLEATTPAAGDVEALAAILRRIDRDPRIGRFSVVACSIATQQVVYRQEQSSRINMPGLGKAYGSLNFGKVNLSQLALKNADTGFLTRLVMEELKGDVNDGVIFVSPKCPLDSNVSQQAIAALRSLDHPVFYLNYARNPDSFPWRDGIGHIVKDLRGFEYTVSGPRDLIRAWSDIMSRLLYRRSEAEAVGHSPADCYHDVPRRH